MRKIKTTYCIIYYTLASRPPTSFLSSVGSRVLYSACKKNYLELKAIAISIHNNIVLYDIGSCRNYPGVCIALIVINCIRHSARKQTASESILYTHPSVRPHRGIPKTIIGHLNNLIIPFH